MMSQELSERFWRDRPDPRIALYRASAADPSREALAEALRPWWPWASLFELGCHCGPVLSHLRMVFGSDWAYCGMDINPLVIREARQFFRLDPDATWIWGSARTHLQKRGTGTADLVVCSSCLSLMAPDAVVAVVQQLLRIARRAVILQEPQRLTGGDGRFCEWPHDYEALARQCGLEDAAMAHEGEIVTLRLTGGQECREGMLTCQTTD